MHVQVHAQMSAYEQCITGKTVWYSDKCHGQVITKSDIITSTSGVLSATLNKVKVVPHLRIVAEDDLGL